MKGHLKERVNSLALTFERNLNANRVGNKATLRPVEGVHFHCGSGEIGRRTILRGWRREACGFKSRLPHKEVMGVRYWVLGFSYQPRIYANISGAQMLASLSTMNFGVSIPSFPQVIFSFGTAPLYEPKLVVESEI